MTPHVLRFSLAAVAAALIALAGCTTTRPPDLPDVVILLDGGVPDTGVDGGFPDPVIDTCTDPGGTIGDSCGDPADCDDGCFCNGVEQCTDGVCVAGADPCENEMVGGEPMDIACTDEACLEETNTCFHMPNHAMCSNGLACDGYEQCDRNFGCVAAAPLYCNDESACTVDSCDDSMGCVYTPRDLDGDGYLAGSCGGDDCDDDPRYGTMIFPGAPEVCDNRRDDDCDGRRDFTDSDCRPMNDTCDTATILPSTAGTVRSGTYSGSTSTLGGHYSLACAPSITGPDAVFRFSLAEPHDVRIAVNGISNAAVALRTFGTCAAGPNLKCSGATAPSVLHRSLPAGEYAIIVRTQTGGSFDLQVTVTDPTTAPPVDVCGAGTEAITASGTYRGRFEETNDDYAMSCHTGGSFRDAVYRLVLAADSDVVIDATATGASFSQSFVALTTNCSSSAATISCVSATGAAQIRRRGLAAGTYFIMIESSDAAAVEWTLNVTITTPPAPRNPGDACSTAIDMPLTGTPAMMTGSGMANLATSELDGGTSCGGSTGTSRDVYFTFELTETRDITLTTNGAGFHYVGLQTMCGVTGSELRCRNGSSPVVQTWRSLPAGRYYVAVATTLTVGTVTTTVETRPPTAIPPNDRCMGAITLTSGDSRRDTLVGFEDDLPVCSGTTGTPDAFYTFTLATSRRVLISASAMPATTVYLSLRNSCSAGAAVTGGCVSMNPTATINTTLPAGTYSLQVDMPAATATDFTIDFVTFAP